MPAKKQPIYRNDEKLIEARAFIPKDCIVDSIIARKPDGSKVECHVHMVGHVFASE